MENKGINTILFDIDGVLLDHEDCNGHNWCREFKNDFNIPVEVIEQLHKNAAKWKELSLGKIQLENYLKDFLSEHNINTVNALQLVSYISNHDICTRKYMFEEVAKIKERCGNKYKLCIATHQEPNKADRLWYVEGYKNYFDGMYTSYGVGHLKTEIEFYNVISNDLGIKNNQMMLIDDKQKNVDTAKSAGCDGYLYTTFEDIKHNLFDTL